MSTVLLLAAAAPLAAQQVPSLDLARVMRDSTFRDNLILLAGDSLYVPLYQPIVTVEGSVNPPASAAYVPGRGVGYYVDRARGYTRKADKGRTYVVEPNGTIFTGSPTVEPGARIVVPERPPGEGANWLQVAGSVAGLRASAPTLLVVVQRL